MSKLFGRPVFHLLLIIVVGTIIYSNTFSAPFVFDDAESITKNYKLHDLSNFWPPAEPRWFGLLTFALNYHFGGLNTVGYHIVNLIIHILNAILVYYLAALTFRTPYFQYHSVRGSECQSIELTFHPCNYLPLFVALIFVSHPIQTQSVTYIVQRFTSLAAMFYLLSLVMYIKARIKIEAEVKFFSSAALIFYFFSLISAVLAMKTKEISFTLPFIIVLYEFFFFSAWHSTFRITHLKRFIVLLPFLLTLLIIPLSLVDIDKPLGDLIGEIREAAQETENIPRWSYLFTQFRVIVTYIRLLFLPITQNLDYDYPVYHSFSDPNVLLSFVFLLFVFGVGVYLLYSSRLKKVHSSSFIIHSNNKPSTTSYELSISYERIMAFGIFWFFITLSVESSLIPIKDVIFEHRLYLPSVGAILAFCAAVFYFLSRLTLHASRFFLTVFIAVLAVVVVVFSFAAYQRNSVWKDDLDLWTDVIKKNSHKARVYLNLGLAYQNRKAMEEAIKMYAKGLEIEPGNERIYNNLGVIFSEAGQCEKAIEKFSMAIMINPKQSVIYRNRGRCYFNIGQYDRALEDFTKAIVIGPSFAELYNNRGSIYGLKGQFSRAVKDFTKAIELNPNFAGFYLNRGRAYSDSKQFENANKDFQKACDLDSQEGCDALKILH